MGNLSKNFIPFFSLFWVALSGHNSFHTWVYVSRLAGSPNLTGRQQNNLKSFIHSGERGPYSVLEKLPVAADWIVYHALVPLFLDFVWASVRTGGEWRWWRKDPSIKHGREGKAEDCLDIKETVNQGSVLCLITEFSMGSFSHSGGSGLAVTVVAIAQSCALKPEVIHITVTTGQQHNK